ncbi:MAG: DUF2027 domain-containing protein [Muribaculaceae bacterium]|nr:DUF2027 domain-containing protein [Muribaculaceae bacterium]
MESLKWCDAESLSHIESHHSLESDTLYGDLLSLAVAVVPTNPELPERSRFTISLVNDSNYYLSFCIFRTSVDEGTLVSKGTIEPNVAFDFATLSWEDFKLIPLLRLQAFAFKIDRLFDCQPLIDREISFDSTFLRKSSSYKPGVYFETPVVETALMRDGKNLDVPRLDTSMLQQAFGSRIAPIAKRRKQTNAPSKLLEPVEVDLHIHELVDTTAGMDNYAMLQLQLSTVRKTMDQHIRRLGQKIVFIHGKGDGVLRKEVRALLSKEYPECDVQDASFQKYGFGATSVTIHRKQSK